MKQIMILCGTLLVMGLNATSYANAEMADQATQHHMKHMESASSDHRVSLKLTPQMKQHQLANMRSHLEAVRDIIGLMASEKFDEASDIAYNKLGLTPEMEKMCSMFGNDGFKQIGLAFHKSADDLGSVLKTKNATKSLQALRSTMNYCIQCHASFRQ